MFDWDRFKNGKIAVHCDTEEKANDFLKECNKQGITWTDGDKTTEINCWFWYEKDTSYACSEGKSKLTFESLEHYKDKGLEIIKWEIDKMKELTFKEVIANIKEGQVWENKSQRVSKIYINKSGNIQLEGEDNSFSSNFSTCVGPDVKYKLQRKEYTFEEAFKAYEEGEEIESIKSGCKYKGGKFKLNNQFSEWLPLRSIPIEEIEGEWYIND